MPRTIEPGKRVRVKTTLVGARLGITPFALRGGEGVVTEVRTDATGPLVLVFLFDLGHCKPVRPESIVVHRERQKVHTNRNLIPRK